MSDIEDSTDEVREAAIGVLTGLLYSLDIIKGENNHEQLSNFLDIILKSLYSFFILINYYNVSSYKGFYSQAYIFYY